MRFSLTKLSVYFSILLMFYVFLGSANGRELMYVDEALKPAKLQGSGKLTWWGLHVYDASFYRSGNFNSPEFALELRYQRSLNGGAIANRSADEMKKWCA